MTETASTESSDKSEARPSTRPIHKRFWFFIVILAVLAYVIWCTGLYIIQDHLVFPVEYALSPVPGLPGSDTAVIKLDIENGGQVEAWFMPAASASSENPAPVVFLFHGNAELIDHQISAADAYLSLGCSVLLPEYRGYGRSAGRPSQKGILADNIRFYDQIVKRPDVDRSLIVYHGKSLGGGIAVDLATQRKPTAMILESTFTSVASMAYQYGAPQFLAKHPFRSDRFVAGTDIPLLIFHGTYDSIIPVSNGRKLRDLAANARYVEYDCDHNDFPGRNNREDYWNEIIWFLLNGGIIAGDHPNL